MYFEGSVAKARSFAPLFPLFSPPGLVGGGEGRADVRQEELGRAFELEVGFALALAGGREMTE